MVSLRSERYEMTASRYSVSDLFFLSVVMSKLSVISRTSSVLKSLVVSVLSMSILPWPAERTYWDAVSGTMAANSTKTESMSFLIP